MSQLDAIEAVRILHEQREGIRSDICGHCTDIATLNSIDPYFEVEWPCATINRMDAAL